MKWSLAGLALSLVACGGALPQTHFYRLALADVSRAPVVLAGTLAVENFDSDAVYADDRIAYRRSPYRVDYYNYHRWIAAPAIHLADYMRDALAQTGLFQRVRSVDVAGSDAALSGRLTAFDEVDVSAAEWVGRIEVELYLSDSQTAAPLWSKRYIESQRVSRRDPEGLAVALSAAAQRIVQASAPEIAAAMRDRAARVAAQDAGGS